LRGALDLRQVAGQAHTQAFGFEDRRMNVPRLPARKLAIRSGLVDLARGGGRIVDWQAGERLPRRC